MSIRRWSYLSILIAGLALLALWISPSPEVGATTFNPSTPGIVESTSGDMTPLQIAPGSSPDLDTDFDVIAPDSNFCCFVGLADQDFAVAGLGRAADGGTGRAADPAALAIGAFVGTLTSTATLGILGSGCGASGGGTTVQVNFTLINASVDDSAGNRAAPEGPPTQLLSNFIEDDGDIDGDGTVDIAARNGNGIPDGAEWYPQFLRDSLEEKGGGTFVTPSARYYGTGFVVGTGSANTLRSSNSAIRAVLQTLHFNAGEMTNIASLSTVTSTLGLPSLTFLQNPLQEPSNSSITDFCTTLLSATTLFGESHDNDCTTAGTIPASCQTCPGTPCLTATAVDGGLTNDTSPGEAGSTRTIAPSTVGTRTFYNWVMSLRDTDNDDVENSLDPCQTSADPGWDPRDTNANNATGGTDDDADGLPNSCDPNDGDGLADQDADGWNNRLDNCATSAGTNGDVETTLTTAGAAINDMSITVVSTTDFATGDTISIGTGGGGSGPTSDRRTNITVVDGTTISFATGLTNTHAGFETVFRNPLPNQGQFDQDIAPPTEAADDGPRSDGINGPCDSNLSVPTGHFHRQLTLSRICVGAGSDDSDLDGVCNAEDPNDALNNSDGGLAGDSVLDRFDNCIQHANPPVSGFGQTDSDLDGLGDSCDAVPLETSPACTDTDLDGFCDTKETALGTSPTSPCPQGASPGTDDWPPDLARVGFANYRIINSADVFEVTSHFFHFIGTDGSDPRRNLVGGTIGPVILSDDVFAVTSRFFTKCAP